MGSIVAAAQALATELQAYGIAATHDPAKAAAAVTTVYVEPPSIDYTTRVTRWRLVALSNHRVGGLGALAALDPLVQEVTDRLPIESATFAAYQLTLDRPPFPAYLLTLTR